MKKTYNFLFLCLLITPSVLISQITITQSDFTSIFTIGNTNTSFADTLTESINIGQPGGGNTWDFTDLTAHHIFEIEYLSPAETPYADSFANANIANYISSTFNLGDGSSGISESWGYFNTNDGATYGNGTQTTFTDMSGTTTTESVTHHIPPFNQYNFPLTFDKIWSVSDSVETNSYSEGNLVFSQVSKSIYNMHIDAWGSMIMPSGKNVEALRSREQTISTSFFSGIPIVSSISVHYFFMTKTGESLSILADSENPPISGVITGSVAWGNDDVTSVEKLESIPTQFSLKQNYPNPFNPSTRIEYSITNSTNVKLKVYDILGNEIALLVNETQSAGNYRYQFDGSNLTSGIYFIQLQAGDKTDIKKMTLMK